MTKTNTDLAAAKGVLADLNGSEPVSVLAAVSGGLDSMCLLHLLSTWGRERHMEVTAAHFNHQLRGAESDRDETFVRDWCEERTIPVVCGRGDVRAYAGETGQTLEEAARTLRYQFLEEQKQTLGCAFVLTAHHADDNAETMLLNLLRGTGARGLAGIPAFRDGVLRPFLRVARTELMAYAEENHISYVEDSTNAWDDAARNVLRHKVLPVLRELNPRAVENMIRTAELLARDEKVLSRAAEQLLEKCRFEEDCVRMSVADSRDADWAVLSRCIRMMLTRIGGHQKDLSAAHVETVCELLQGAIGKEVFLPYDMRARREEADLVIWRHAEIPQDIAIRMGEAVTFGSWRVELMKDSGGLALWVPEDAVVEVTAWRRDDRMRLPGDRGERSLKRLCADRGISPTERDTLPVLRINGQAAAVPGIGIHLDFLPCQDRDMAHVIFYRLIEERQI